MLCLLQFRFPKRDGLSGVGPFELVVIGFISTWVSPDVKAYNEEVKVKRNAKHENEANRNYTIKSRDR